jgi:hypothetical protein
LFLEKPKVGSSDMVDEDGGKLLKFFVSPVNMKVLNFHYGGPGSIPGQVILDLW